MLSGGTLRASEMAGTAVFRIVVSSDSIKNATATSHGKRRLLEADGLDCIGEASIKLSGFMGKHCCERAGQLSYRNTLAIFTNRRISMVCILCRQLGSIHFAAPGLDRLTNHPHNTVVDQFVGYSR